MKPKVGFRYPRGKGSSVCRPKPLIITKDLLRYYSTEAGIPVQGTVRDDDLFA